MSPSPDSRSSLWLALGFAWQFGYTVAVPLVVFTLAGRFLDVKLGTHPWLLIVGVILAASTSTIALVRKASRILSQSAPPPDSRHGDLPRR